MSKTIGIINNPLNGKNIENLIEKDFEVLPLPYFNVERLENVSENAKIVNNLLEFDWLIFTDIFSVDFFVEELLQSEFDLFELDNLRICALGEAVADRLRFSQIHADIISGKLNDDLIQKDFENYVASDNEIKDLRILIIKNDEFKTDLKDKLNNKCRYVMEISVYSIKIEEYANLAKYKILIDNGAFDEIIFYSVEDLQMFRIIFGNRSFKDLAENIKLIAKDETVRKSIEELKY